MSADPKNPEIDSPADSERTMKVFLSHLRHDLRTPVNAIIGYGEMLVEDATQPGLGEFAATMQQVPLLGKTLLSLINEILDAGKLDRLGNDLNLETLANSMRREVGEPARKVVVHCDNLLQQAMAMDLDDFIPDLEKIREAGHRLLALLAQDIGASCAASKKAQHAAPAAESMPVQDSADAGSPPADSPADGVKGHLLVVDDIDFNREILGRAVTRQGHTFAVARNGKQALDIIAPTGFDLVLLDVNMPELDGVQVLKRLKADPKLRHIPVIMISALDEIDTVVRCIEMGAEDYLPKPFDPVLLKARIGACLEKKRLRDTELEYLRNVAAITSAAAAVEAGTFDASTLNEAAARTDALGKLAQMFQNMAREVQNRERQLKQQVQQLRVEIDQARKAKQVAEVTESGYFQDLQQKIDSLRKRRGGPNG